MQDFLTLAGKGAGMHHRQPRTVLRVLSGVVRVFLPFRQFFNRTDTDNQFDEVEHAASLQQIAWILKIRLISLREPAAGLGLSYASLCVLPGYLAECRVLRHLPDEGGKKGLQTLRLLHEIFLKFLGINFLHECHFPYTHGDRSQSLRPDMRVAVAVAFGDFHIHVGFDGLFHE